MQEVRMRLIYAGKQSEHLLMLKMLTCITHRSVLVMVRQHLERGDTIRVARNDSPSMVKLLQDLELEEGRPDDSFLDFSRPTLVYWAEGGKYYIRAAAEELAEDRNEGPTIVVRGYEDRPGTYYLTYEKGLAPIERTK